MLLEVRLRKEPVSGRVLVRREDGDSARGPRAPAQQPVVLRVAGERNLQVVEVEPSVAGAVGVRGAGEQRPEPPRAPSTAQPEPAPRGHGVQRVRQVVRVRVQRVALRERLRPEPPAHAPVQEARGAHRHPAAELTSPQALEAEVPETRVPARGSAAGSVVVRRVEERLLQVLQPPLHRPLPPRPQPAQHSTQQGVLCRLEHAFQVPPADAYVERLDGGQALALALTLAPPTPPRSRPW